MNTELEKAKQILQNLFCPTPQENTPIESMGKMLDEEDTKFLISINTNLNGTCYGVGDLKEKSSFSNEELEEIFGIAKRKGYLGIKFFETDFNSENEKFFRENNFLRDISWHEPASVWIDNVFFNEEDFIKPQIVKILRIIRAFEEISHCYLGLINSFEKAE